jgi:hypothetical protein
VKATTERSTARQEIIEQLIAFVFLRGICVIVLPFRNGATMTQRSRREQEFAPGKAELHFIDAGVTMAPFRALVSTCQEQFPK